jgi:hypothetical protein
MAGNPDQDQAQDKARSGTGNAARTARDARRKAALKANMARRKAQAQARSGLAEDNDKA